MESCSGLGERALLDNVGSCNLLRRVEGVGDGGGQCCNMTDCMTSFKPSLFGTAIVTFPSSVVVDCLADFFIGLHFTLALFSVQQHFETVLIYK